MPMPTAATASDLPDAADRLDRDGFAIVPHRLSPDLLSAMIERIERAVDRRETATREGRPHASLRNLLDHIPDLPDLLAPSGIGDLIENLLHAPPFITRGILFDKVDGANWSMLHHQDLTIAVAERRDAPGFGPWSVKDSVTHVEPPVPILERMVAIRIHLDPCDATNGALSVVPGSHRLGRIEPARRTEIRARLGQRLCPVPAGGIMLMRPLTLHASAPAERPRHRRVIHLEIAADDLPVGLQWHRRVPLEPRRARPQLAGSR